MTSVSVSKDAVASNPCISLVIPVYNEAHGIRETLEAAEQVLREISDDYEIIVVDDGSTDQTWECVRCVADRDRSIRLIRFTRNFGKDSAILAGLKHSRGEGIVVMDGDLQHPPEILREMVRLWREEGYKVVHGVKERRQEESFFHRLFAKIFYGLMRVFSGYDLKGETDYKLLDRSVVDRYVGFPEKVRFFRGLIPWMGFRDTSVAFSPTNRKEGGSRWGSFALVRLGVRAICAFSSIPMQVVSILGGFMFIASLMLGFQTFYMKLTGRAVEGFSTVILLLLFIGSILMVSLGLIGQYLSMIYEEVKDRPAFVIDKTLNFEP